MSKSIKKFIATNVKFIPAATTVILFIIAYIVGGIQYGSSGFLTLRTFFSIFTDNAFLGISAIGMTFVIISGGIDLSVGAVAALSTMILAYGSEKLQINMLLCVLLALTMGVVFGLFMGILIQIFEVPPFIATLAGMFMARGLCFVISIESITIKNEWFKSIGNWRIPVRDFLNFKKPNLIAPINIGVFIFLAILILGIILLHSTKFGRNVYAIGGNEQSAKLMGLPVKRTRILIYVLNGFCSALAGIVYALALYSGYGRHLIGMELDVISATVIGGTILSGGIGYPLGSLFGVMTQAIILKFINFSGTLSSGWTKISVGVLLFVFIVMQRFVVMISDKNKEE